MILTGSDYFNWPGSDVEFSYSYFGLEVIFLPKNRNPQMPNEECYCGNVECKLCTLYKCTVCVYSLKILLALGLGNSGDLILTNSPSPSSLTGQYRNIQKYTQSPLAWGWKGQICSCPETFWPPVNLDHTHTHTHKCRVCLEKVWKRGERLPRDFLVSVLSLGTPLSILPGICA